MFEFSLAPRTPVTIAPARGPIVRVPRVILPELVLGGMSLAHIEALVLDFPSPLRLDGILGMNVLGRFRVTLECDTSTVVLRPL